LRSFGKKTAVFCRWDLAKIPLAFDVELPKATNELADMDMSNSKGIF
jgi:hypothetical protein